MRRPWSEIESAVPAGNRKLCEAFDAASFALTKIALVDGTRAETRRQLTKVRESFDRVFRDALEKINVLRGQNHVMGMASRNTEKVAPKWKAPDHQRNQWLERSVPDLCQVGRGQVKVNQVQEPSQVSRNQARLLLLSRILAPVVDSFPIPVRSPKN